MAKFAVLIVALALVSGLQAVVVQTNKASISTMPFFIVNGVQQQIPGIQVIEDPIIPEQEPVLPPIQEEVIVPEVKPLPVIQNPCEACFSYMASLIEELTDTVAAEPQLPESFPEPEPVPEEQPETKPVVGISLFPSFPVAVPN